MNKNRLEYLLALKKHCEENGQRFTTKNVKELNELLTKAYYAKDLLDNEHRK